MFEKGQGYKPSILLWPGQEKDSAGKATWPKLTGEYVRSKHPHRLGIQLDVGSGTRVNRDVLMYVDWARVAKLKA
jgi:hypothetical protein